MRIQNIEKIGKSALSPRKEKLMKKISVILIGAGDRGSKYVTLMKAMPEKYEVVGVAEPVEGRRNKIRDMHNIPEENCFKCWSEILAKPKFADLAIISTMDDMHYEPALKAIDLGYDLLLEKPAAQTAKECADIAVAARDKGAKVLVCHVLRYAPFFKKVKDLIDEGAIGKVVSINHIEAVGNVHQSHSFVRGNWHSSEETAPMILAKSCHDVDMIQWLVGSKCKSVQSFGSIAHFNAENAPEGAPVSCVDGECPVRANCPYDCIKLYYDAKTNLWFRGAAARNVAKGAVPTDEEVMEALRTTDYGLCVYHANNDVVDNQVVNMLFENGVTVNFSMNAFNKGGRYIRIFGTKGELYAFASDKSITVYTFEDKQTTMVPVPEIEESILGGHGGGDQGIVTDMYDYLNGTYTGCSVADIATSAKNHYISFAAEYSRLHNVVVDIDALYGDLGL